MVTSIAVVLALAAGRGWGSVWVALAVLAGQLSVGWSNDYVDRHRDRLARRTDKPIAAGTVTSRSVGMAAVAAAVVCVPLSLASGWFAGLVHLGAVGVAWAYNVGLKRTVVSPVPYVLAFGALPVFVVAGLPGRPMPAWWAVVAAALLGGGAHFLNALADIGDDVVLGVHGLPQRLGPRRSVGVGGVLLGCAVTCVVLGPGDGDGWTFIAAAAVLGAVGVIVVLAVNGRHRVAWLATLALALGAVVLLVAQGSSLVR